MPVKQCMEAIIIGLVVIIPVPWSTACVALHIVGGPTRTPNRPLLSYCLSNGLSRRWRGKLTTCSIRPNLIGLGDLVDHPWALLDRGSTGLRRPPTWLPPMVGRPRRGMKRVTLISDGYAPCLRRSHRATREGSNAGRRCDPRCGGRPTALRMPSDNTVRRRSHWLMVASPELCSPRCITAYHSPTVNMVRPGRDPGRKAPRRPQRVAIAEI